MSFKMLNSVDELMDYTGCNNIFIPENNKRYLVYESNTPYMCEYFDWVETEDVLHFILSYAHMARSFLVIPNPNYINMEDYIREYKHLLGCEFVGSPKGKYVVDSFDTFGNKACTILKSIACNAGYMTWLKICKFYTEDDDLVSYKEYMELYYPEYRDVWEKQV